MTEDEFRTIASSYGPEETMQRLETAVQAKCMTVFARIDHALGAWQAGLELRPTAVLIFGNARVGTPLMHATQTIGIDLPLKVLVWQDRAGVTWLSYVEPMWIAARHGIGGDKNQFAEAMAAALDFVAKTAARHDPHK